MNQAYAYIDALSASCEGRELVENLEKMRYYHYDGKVYNLGYGATLVVAWRDENNSYSVVGTILLPGKRDKLYYESAAWKGGNIDAALYWAPGADTYTLIPIALGVWAAELIITDSDVPPYTPEENHGIACSIDGMDGMVVTIPSGFIEPGLTPNKWAYKIAHQRHYRAPYNNRSWVMPGYMPQCSTIYGAYVGDIDHLMWKIECNIWTYADFIDEGNVFAYTSENTLRATCQILSNFKYWEYFDTCSNLQCVIHLMEQNYSPWDISIKDGEN